MDFRRPIRSTLFLAALFLCSLGHPKEPAAQDPSDPAKEAADAARSVRAWFEADKESASSRARAAAQAVAVELREESEREGRIERALKEMTGRTPIRVPVSEGVVLENVRVISYAAGRVKLAWPQGEIEYPLELLPDETRGTLLNGALAKATPRDHFEIGKLLVHGKDYDRAARCFATAAQRDPALAPFVPDLERVKRAARLFEGAFKAAGNTLGIRWGFSSAAEANDFLAVQGNLAVRPGQGLELQGLNLALAAVKEIPFRDRIKASALARETETAAHLLGIRFIKPSGGEVLIYGALATTFKTFLVVRVEDGKSQEVLAPTGGAAGNRMTMDFNRGRFSFLVGDKTVWSGNEGGFTDVAVILGGSAIPRPGAAANSAAAQFREVTLFGEVNPLWMAKKTAGLRDALVSELSKEYAAKRTETSAGLPELSVELVVYRAGGVARAAYQDALAKIAVMRKTMLQTDLAAAQRALERVTAVHAFFAPAWYYRGVLEEAAGNIRSAAAHFDQALALLPDFPEALCARGRVYGLIGWWDRVRADAERALALKPDFGEAHLLLARLKWESKESAAAIESARLARRLAPLDPGLQSSAQMLANVVRGPSWPRPNVHATANYSIRSDLPPAKCRLYAEHLEAVRPIYEEVLGRKVQAGKPADVLIFNAEEGYYSYMDFTAGSREEHTLGAFSPWHGQMALFEGVEPGETPRVLSHEGFHQFLHAIAPDVPIWFNEGMAEYVGSTRVEKGKIVERGGILTGRLDNLKLAVKYGWTPLSFDRIMVESQSEFYGEMAPFKYAQAWSMIRFFIHGDDGRWKGLLREYTDRLLAGDAARAAFEATFAKHDLRDLETAWLKHYGLAPGGKSPSAPAVAPAPAPPPSTAGATDLLGPLLARGIAAEGWALKGNALESPSTGGVPIDLGYEPPAEYDWRLVVQRTQGDGCLFLGLHGGGRSFFLRLDATGTSGLEVLDGKDGVNETFRRDGPSLPSGRAVTVLCSVRNDGVRATIDGAEALNWKGRLDRLSLPASLTGSLPARRLFLFSFDTHFSITELYVRSASAGGIPNPDPDARNVSARIKVDPARSIVLDSAISRWLLDENNQILALQPASNSLLQISIPDRKVVRKVPTGNGPTALCAVPGSPKQVWVAVQGGQSLVRIDLEKGAIVETVPVAYVPAFILAVRKYLWCLDSSWVLHGIDVSDRKDLGTLGTGGISEVAYDSKKDRLWVLGKQAILDYDASRIGMILRELSRKNLTGGERAELQQEMNKATKSYAVSGPLTRPVGYGLLLDDRNGKVYFNRNAAKIERPDLILGAFRPPAHSMGSEPAVRDLLSLSSPFLNEILAASADGKWVASGTHVFSATTLLVQKEVPLPSPLVGFSKDSKTLYYFDWANRVIAALDVEAK